MLNSSSIRAVEQNIYRVMAILLALSTSRQINKSVELYGMMARLLNRVIYPISNQSFCQTIYSLQNIFVYESRELHIKQWLYG